MGRRAGSRFDNFQPAGQGVVVSYLARGGSVSASLGFNALRQIAEHACGASN